MEFVGFVSLFFLDFSSSALIMLLSLVVTVVVSLGRPVSYLGPSKLLCCVCAVPLIVFTFSQI